MLDIDFSKTGATTLLTCGTTNVAHYAIAQQGLHCGAEKACAKEIYEELLKYAPSAASDGWALHTIELTDYKSWHNEKFYKVHAKYFFRKDRETYSKEIDISPLDAKVVYDMFRKATFSLPEHQ